jgi:hypothetical protein
MRSIPIALLPRLIAILVGVCTQLPIGSKTLLTAIFEIFSIKVPITVTVTEEPAARLIEEIDEILDS